MKGTPEDPRGLIQEAYRIEGIVAEECRSIFLDWVLGLPDGVQSLDRVKILLETYKDEPQDHPMTLTLRAALMDQKPARRRGGRAARVSD